MITRAWNWVLTAFLVLLGCATIIGMPLALFGLIVGSEQLENVGKSLSLCSALLLVWWIFSDFGDLLGRLPVRMGKKEERQPDRRDGN